MVTYIEELRKKANGDPEAQYELGFYYEHGEGVEKDLEKAFEWYTKSAEQGDKNAQNHLGLCYANGNGVEQNLHRAIEWFHKSAEQRHTRSKKLLKSLYFHKIDIEKMKDKINSCGYKITETTSYKKILNGIYCKIVKK
jgi:TPR repeat protein